MIDPGKFFKEFKVSGNEALVLCPFHDDHKPSASFNVVTGMFYCFSCGVGKSLPQLCLALGVDQESVYVEELKVKSKGHRSEWHVFMTRPLALDNWYLQLRDVDNSSVKLFGIREYDEGIIFPQYQLHGQLTGVLIRKYNGNPKYQFFGERAPFWPNPYIYTTLGNRRIYLTEGVFGALRAMQAGIPAYAIMSASTIKSVAPMFAGRDVITVFDNDYAGLHASSIGILFGIPAAFPPFVADEASVDEWRKFDEKPTTTQNFLQLAKLSKDPEKMVEQVNKFIGKIWSRNASR